MERKLTNSALLGGSTVTRVSSSNFLQPIAVAYHEQLGLVQYSCKEMVLGRLLLPEFRR